MNGPTAAVRLLALGLGVSEVQARSLIRRIGGAPPEWEATAAQFDALWETAQLEAAGSIDDDDLADANEEPHPEVALRVEHAKRAEQHLRAQVASLASWAQTPDRSARTRAARDAFMARFEREVDPDGLLPEAERIRRAEYAKKAYFLRMSLKSARARRLRKTAREP